MTIIGLAGVVAGHPFDTVKVRLQSVQRQGTTIKTFLNIIKNENVTGLYKGMASPLIGVVTINACLFGVYGHLMDWLTRSCPNNSASTNVFIAGCGSGLANSLISCPSELAKIQLQCQITEKRYKGPWQCFREIYQRYGISGCYRGMASTVLRETPSYGVYFLCFEGLKDWWDDDTRGRKGNAWKLMVAGGLSGVLGWLSTYPFDVVKTRIQAMPISEARMPSTMQMLRQIAKTEGVNALFKGVNATIVRAFPTNAIIFYAYSLSMDFIAALHEE